MIRRAKGQIGWVAVGVIAAVVFAAVAQDALATTSPPHITTSFGASSVALNGSTSLSFSIGNPNLGTGVTGINFTDSLPPGLVVATPSELNGDCGGTVTATTGSSQVSLSGGTLSAGSGCAISLNLTGTWGGQKSNSVTVNSAAGTGNTDVASLTVAGPPAGDRVYWANGNANKISFANLDGSGGGDLATGSATVSGPNGVTVDSADGRIYWANHNANKISFANLDGSGGGDLATGIATVSGPIGVAVDPAAGRIYWANFVGNKISFARLDGSGGGDLATGIATVNSPQGVAVYPAAGRIYWANGGDSKISFANLDGSGGGDVTTTGATTSTPTGVAVDPVAGRIYWANFYADKVSYAKLDGTGGGDVSNGGATVNVPTGVAVDPVAGRIYWTNLSAGGISFANLGGGGGGDLSTVYASGNGLPVLLKAPSGAGVPAITGGSTTGSTLSCSNGSWGPDLLESLMYRAPQTFAYQWSLNGSDIPGATSSTYTTAAAGDYRCRVIAANAAGSASQTSAADTIVPPPPACQPVAITTTAGAAVAIQLACADASSAVLTYALDSNPAHGSLSGFDPATGRVSYTSASGYSGQDSFTYHATSGDGIASPQTVSITISGGAGGGSGQGPGNPAGHAEPPSITAASLSHNRFRVARQPTAVSAAGGHKPPLGTTVRFTLSAGATVRITIQRSLPGLRSGGRCVAPSRRHRSRHAKRCRRVVTVGVLTRANQLAGRDSVPFSGRIGPRALAPGIYQAALAARDAAGISPAIQLTFTVVRSS